MPKAFASPSNSRAKCAQDGRAFAAGLFSRRLEPIIYVGEGAVEADVILESAAGGAPEPDELRRWAGMGLEAARRAAEARAKPTPKRKARQAKV